MTYFRVLAVFLIPPLLGLLAIVPTDVWRWLRDRSTLVHRRAYIVILIHVLLALVYTTPWDNYLVATGVWTYPPELVSGVILGWVPLEEYLFFVLQTLTTGLWALAMRRIFPRKQARIKQASAMRRLGTAILALIWVIWLIILLSGWRPGTYAALILVWGLIPVLIQVAFGADILFANGRALVAAILPTTMYLWLVDMLAIRSGTWTIDLGQSTGLMIAGLPLEEMLFFLMTNVIIVFGVNLMLDEESQTRARDLKQWWQNFTHISPREGEKIQSLRLVRSPRVLGLWISLVLWIVILIATPIAMWLGGEGLFPLMASLGVLAQCSATLFSMYQGWAFRKVAGVALIVLVLAWMIEWLGVMTGFPFGDYHYTEILRPKLGNVPWLIPIAWLMMLVPSWAVGQAALGGIRERLKGLYWVTLAVISGAAFTAWDLYLDPQMTERGLWSWEHPGGYFGIPWVNFGGWWLSAALITLILRPANLPQRPLIVIYTLTWAFQAVGLGIFWGQPGPALAGFLAMGVFVLLAVIRVAPEGNHLRGWRGWIRYFGLWPDF